MKTRYVILLGAVWLITTAPLFAQEVVNCFLEDFEPKAATVPPYEDVAKTTEAATVTVTINAADTLGKVSKYILGNAAAVWVGQNINTPVLVGHLQKLAPSLIRFPGGSWSDIYFWNGNPGDLPPTIYNWQAPWNFTEASWSKAGFSPQLGPQYALNVDQYYSLRDQIGSQGLITINYGYARYGTSEKPAEQAAHYAAEWVRKDNGRTKFWEIGNESAGPWEAGCRIDTSLNKDGQPEYITGELYGKHFKIFADSMKAAAAEVGATIYIGGQILQFNAESPSHWNPSDRTWNSGFFREVGEAADFYVIHNYFGGNGSSVKAQVDAARSAINQNITFIRQDIANKQAPAKPIALTEWNMGGPDLAKTSIANGMQAVVLFCEMIKNNFGMSARWLIANWESDGMFYYRNPTLGIPLWNPRPDFFYVYYLQRFVGDHTVSTAVTGSTDVLAYATKFSSGHAGVVVVNKGTTDRVVKLAPGDFSAGERFYIYSLTDGTDNSAFPQAVYVNDEGPASSAEWGPIESLEAIPAYAYQVGDEIKFASPARSVQFVLVESDQSVAVDENRGPAGRIPATFTVYPNPATGFFKIDLQKGGFNKLEIFDVLGRRIYSKVIDASQTVLQLQPNLTSGVYFVRLFSGKEVKVRKLLIQK